MCSPSQLVAQEFVEKHRLPRAYIRDIIKHITPHLSAVARAEREKRENWKPEDEFKQLPSYRLQMQTYGDMNFKGEATVCDGRDGHCHKLPIELHVVLTRHWRDW